MIKENGKMEKAEILKILHDTFKEYDNEIDTKLEETKSEIIQETKKMEKENEQTIRNLQNDFINNVDEIILKKITNNEDLRENIEIVAKTMLEDKTKEEINKYLTKQIENIQYFENKELKQINSKLKDLEKTKEKIEEIEDIKQNLNLDEINTLVKYLKENKNEFSAFRQIFSKKNEIQMFLEQYNIQRQEKEKIENKQIINIKKFGIAIVAVSFIINLFFLFFNNQKNTKIEEIENKQNQIIQYLKHKG
jgi:hypothetical protein